VRRSALAAATFCCLALLGGCRRREAPEVVKARVTARLLHEQIRSLDALVAKADSGGLGTEEQVAIAVSEEVVKSLVGASLPLDVKISERVKLRLESVEAFFRGNRSGLLLRARVSSADLPDAFATLELGCVLREFAFAEGKLSTGVSVEHFRVIESSAGDLAADLVENLVKQNLDAIQRAIPTLVVPVNLEESVKIDGLSEGVVVARPGTLPLAISVAQVLPVNGRLWILLDAKAGPWKPLSAAGEPEAKPGHETGAKVERRPGQEPEQRP
jgi:hypothetical protein